MDNSLITYMTGKLVGELPEWIRKIKFINPDYKNFYDILSEYKSAYVDLRRTEDEEMSSIMGIIKSIQEFQVFAESVDDPVLLAQKSKELFIFEDIKAAKAIDPQIFKMIKIKDELISEVNSLMSSIYFTNDADLEKEVTHYLKSRGKLDIEIELPQEN